MTGRLKNNPDYRRLKLGGRGIFARNSHWLGKDLLLVVEVTNYSERYRRFYFRDMQAVIVQRTRARTWWSFGLAITTAPVLLGLVYVWLTEDLPTLMVAGSGMGILVILGVTGLVFNALRGPTCAVHVRTAVQTQRLRGIGRWRKAEDLIAALTPLVRAAQLEAGFLTPPGGATSAMPVAAAAADVPPVAGGATS